MAKILIIEDEIKIAEVVAAYLQKNGHESNIELNGKSGQKAFMEKRFDLVILDLTIKDGMDGKKAMKTLIDSVECYDIVYHDLEWALQTIGDLHHRTCTQ